MAPKGPAGMEIVGYMCEKTRLSRWRRYWIQKVGDMEAADGRDGG